MAGTAVDRTRGSEDALAFKFDLAPHTDLSVQVDSRAHPFARSSSARNLGSNNHHINTNININTNTGQEKGLPMRSDPVVQPASLSMRRETSHPGPFSIATQACTLPTRAASSGTQQPMTAESYQFSKRATVRRAESERRPSPKDLGATSRAAAAIFSVPNSQDTSPNSSPTSSPVQSRKKPSKKKKGLLKLLWGFRSSKDKEEHDSACDNDESNQSASIPSTPPPASPISPVRVEQMPLRKVRNMKSTRE